MQVVIDYASPGISGLTPRRMPLSGPGSSSLLTIAGVNFGYVELGASLGVLLQAERGAVTMQVLQHSDGQIVAKVEQGAGGVVSVPQEGGEGSRGFQVTVVVRVGGVGGSGQVQVAKAQMEFVPASGQVALQLSNAAASMLDLYTDASREAFRALVACITARGAGAATCASADAQDICVVEVGLKAEADRNGGKRRQTSARSDVVVTLRFLSAISAPASGVAMLRAFHQALVTCCLNSNALEIEASVSEEILCSPLSVARAGGQVCSDLARLGVLQAVFEKGSLDEAAGAGGGAVTAETSPPIPPSGSGGGGGGLDAPAWVVPGISVGAAAACLLAGFVGLIRYCLSLRMRTMLWCLFFNLLVVFQSVC